MIERQFNSGEMPRTDFRYEEFERLLGSYYLTMLPLKEGAEQDQTDFEAITGVLNGFAERHRVQKPEEAVAQPRPTPETWGQLAAIGSCSSVVNLMGSFWRDFGVGAEPETIDMQERLKLGRLVLGVLHRYGVIQAKFEEIDGVQTPVQVLSENRAKFYQPLQAVLASK